MKSEMSMYQRKFKHLKHIFFYNYFDIFTKSSTVYKDQLFYKNIYSQQ